MDLPQHDDFAPHLGQPVEVAGDALDGATAEAVTMALVEVELGHPDEPHRGFTVVLDGPPQPQLSQAMRQIRLPDGRTWALFLRPFAADADGVRYEAILDYG